MHYATAIERDRVQSSALRSLGYDRHEWVLQVEFTNGKVYNYFRVPALEFERLRVAPSKGEFVNREIKPYYEYELVETG